MRYTDVKGLTKLFPVSRSQIYQMVEQNEIPFYRFGKGPGCKIVFDVVEVEEWLTSRVKLPSEKELLGGMKAKLST